MGAGGSQEDAQESKQAETKEEIQEETQEEKQAYRNFNKIESGLMRWQILHGTIKEHRVNEQTGWGAIQDIPIPDAVWGLWHTWSHVKQS